MKNTLSKRKILNLTDEWLKDANLSLSVLEGVSQRKIYKLLKKVMKIHDINSYEKNTLKDLASAISNKDLFSNKVIKVFRMFFEVSNDRIITKAKEMIIANIQPILFPFFAKKQILLL